jgi:protein MPE1
MSSVYYKFASSKNESRVTFDGTHVSVFDIKKEIMLNNKMGSGKDFDLGLYDAATGEGKSFSSKHQESTVRTILLYRTQRR